MTETNDALIGEIIDLLEDEAEIKLPDADSFDRDLVRGIIDLIRADERKRIAAAINAKSDEVRLYSTDMMGGMEIEDAGRLSGLSMALTAAGLEVPE